MDTRLAGSRSSGKMGFAERLPSVCTNSIRVARTTVESVLLDDVRRELLGPAAYAASEQEAKELLSRDAPDPTQARRALAPARKEADNIMNAIRAGIVTLGTKAALEAAEAGVTAATEALATIQRFEPAKVLPRAREVYRGLVERPSRSKASQAPARPSGSCLAARSASSRRTAYRTQK